MLFADCCPADPEALQAGRLDQCPGRLGQRVAEPRARAGGAQGLVFLAPVLDCLEARLDFVG